MEEITEEFGDKVHATLVDKLLKKVTSEFHERIWSETSENINRIAWGILHDSVRFSVKDEFNEDSK